jgi:hypothetical protein
MTPIRIAVALVTTLALTMTTASASAAGGHGGGGRGGHGGGHGWHGGHSRVSIGLGWGGYGYPYYPYYPYSYAPYYWPYYTAPYAYAASAATAPVYVERGGAQAQSGSWYYCQQLNGYYPYVRECPGQWTPVPMQPPAQAPAPAAG